MACSTCERSERRRKGVHLTPHICCVTCGKDFSRKEHCRDTGRDTGCMEESRRGKKAKQEASETRDGFAGKKLKLKFVSSWAKSGGAGGGV